LTFIVEEGIKQKRDRLNKHLEKERKRLDKSYKNIKIVEKKPEDEDGQ
jgi:hypothetical protein